MNVWRNKKRRILFITVAIFSSFLFYPFCVFAGAAFSTITVNTPARTGGCPGSYTISLNTPNSVLNRMSLGAAVSITFNAAAGIDATTCTGGTYNGSAIGTMTLTATTVSFSSPILVNHNTAFTIVLNGITNGVSVAAGTISVSIAALSGTNTGTTTNSYTTSASGVPTTSSAGPDQEICGATTTTTMAGNAPAIGTGTWTLISGSGTITTPSDPLTGITGLGAGANVFRWTIANAPCASSTDDIIVHKGTGVGGTASATTNCATSSVLSLSGEVGTIQWQQNINGGGWTDIVGATTDPYTVTINPANSYDFRANLTNCLAADLSTTASRASITASGFALTASTTSPPNNVLPSCLADYTFSATTSADMRSEIVLGATITVTFPAGTDATTMTAGTFNGVAINMGTVITTATTVTFNAPVAVTCLNSSISFTLNNITNPPTSGTYTASVSAVNISGGADTFTSASYYIAATPTSFYDINGMWPVSMATAQTNDWCDTLAVGSMPSTICFQYTLPPDSLYTSFSYKDCIGNSGSVNTGSPSGCNQTGPTTAKILGWKTYNASCGLISNTGSYGYCGGGVAGDVITVCITLATTGCTNDVILCPVINCYSGDCSSVLPIELLFFNAKKENDIVQLNWATAAEINNDYFTIERTVDGIFYQTITTLKGAGNSSSTLFYNTEDVNPPMDQIVYYRLKQTDYDGKYAYSKLISVNSESTENNLKLTYFYVDNNNNMLRYGVEQLNDKKCSFQIIDMFGRELRFQKSENTENIFRSIDISDLSKGMYLFKVTDGSEVVLKKFFR